MERINFVNGSISYYEYQILKKIYMALSLSYPKETSEWFQEIGDSFHQLKQKWLLDNVYLLPGSTLGIVLQAYSQKFAREVVVKMIPPYIMRYEEELMAYQHLSKTYMCPLMDYDLEHHALLLQHIVPGVSFDFYKDKKKLKDFFAVIYEHTFISDGLQAKTYFHLYNEKVEIAQKDSFRIDLRKSYHRQTEKLIKYYFSADDLYFMHGDLHSGNVISYGDSFCTIDPLGFLAPRDFMFARFAVFQLIFEPDKRSKIYEIIKFLEPYTNGEKFMAALLIDTDLAVHTGIVQSNDGYKMVTAFIELMDFLKKYMDY